MHQLNEGRLLHKPLKLGLAVSEPDPSDQTITMPTTLTGVSITCDCTESSPFTTSPRSHSHAPSPCSPVLHGPQASDHVRLHVPMFPAHACALCTPSCTPSEQAHDLANKLNLGTGAMPDPQQVWLNTPPHDHVATVHSHHCTRAQSLSGLESQQIAILRTPEGSEGTLTCNCNHGGKWLQLS